MQRRRRSRAVPRDIFGQTTSEARERLAEQRARNNERRQQAIEEAIQPPPTAAIEEAIQPPPTARPPKREGFRHKVLETPHSPPVRIAHDETLSRQTESAVSNIESSFERRDGDTGIVRKVTGMKDLTEALSELQREDEESFKRWVLEEMIPKLEDDADRLSEERGLAQEKMWSDQEVARLYRDREVLEYEARKEENNGFLKCFNIRSMPGPNLRALILLNNTLSKYRRNAAHIGEGKIMTFKEGVRIVLDSRETMRGALKGSKAVEALVGPYHKRTCLIQTGSSPSPDWIVGMVMLAHNRWPDALLENDLRGDEKLDINYQLGLWKSKEYHTIEELVKQHYASLGIEEAVHSIETPRTWKEVRIGTLSKKDKLALIGKSGRNVANLRKNIKEKMGKYWKVIVEELK